MCSNFVSSVKHIPDLEVAQAVSDLGGAEDLYEKMFRLVLRLTPQNVGQMDEHLYSQGDLGAFAIKIHGTKGSLNQLGNKKLGKYAESLEKAAKAGDKKYCAEHFGDFKNRLLFFFGQVEDVILKNGKLEENEKDENTPTENVRNFLDAFAKARKAVEDYDSIAALDILSPLVKLHFDGNADKLIAAAVEELETFKLKIALQYIMELQKEYGNV